MRTRDIFVLALVASLLVVVLVAIFTNLSGFHNVTGELHNAVDTVALGLWDGVRLVFFVFLSLGALYAAGYGYVKFRHMNRFHVVGHTKHGPSQAVVLANGTVEHLNVGQAQMDPAQQLEMLRKAMQVLSANQTMMKRFPLEEDTVEAGQNKQIAPPVAPLPTNVLYDDVRGQVPRGHILVGIGRAGLETKAKAVGACVWIVGLSGTGKTSTTVLRVEERATDGHKFLGIDPHWFKPDSLSNAVAGYADKFLLPMARTPEESKNVLQAFLAEFNGRKAGRIPQPWQKITLLCDEVGAMMDPTSEEEEEIAKMLPSIARICGQEARNFNMGGIFISQQATGLSWLRKVALMVIVHQLLQESEKKLATNNDTAAMLDMKTWPIGRTYVFGVGFQEGPRTVQQPYFARQNDTVESTLVQQNQSDGNTDPLLPADLPQNFKLNNGNEPGKQSEERGSKEAEITDLSTVKELREIGRRLKNGEDPAKIVKSYGLPYGRATQELSAVVQMMAEQIDIEMQERG